jgi:hypothetical protein
MNLPPSRAIPKTRFAFVCSLFCLLAPLAAESVPAPPAATGPAPTKPLPAPAYVMSVVCFSDTLGTKPEWIFVVGSIAYRTLEDFKKGIAHFPKGSTLTWDPGCKRLGGEPLETEAALKDFVAYCESQGVKFVRVPSG